MLPWQLHASTRSIIKITRDMFFAHVMSNNCIHRRLAQALVDRAYKWRGVSVMGREAWRTHTELCWLAGNTHLHDTRSNNDCVYDGTVAWWQWQMCACCVRRSVQTALSVDSQPSYVCMLLWDETAMYTQCGTMLGLQRIMWSGDLVAVLDSDSLGTRCRCGNDGIRWRGEINLQSSSILHATRRKIT